MIPLVYSGLSKKDEVFEWWDCGYEVSDLNQVLIKIDIPTIILWGDKDRLTHVSGAAILESLMPNAKRIVMNNIGHMPMMENPELAAKYFIEFFEIKQ